MSHLDHQIRRVQRRLWLNRWMHAFFFCLAFGAGFFAVVVLVQRLYDLSWPLFWVGFGLGGAALVGSLVWMWVTREDVHVAATQLDEAAGLRERLSSAQYCRNSDDPFARAVVADAEKVSTALSVRRHIRLRLPEPLPWASFAIVAAALMFLITPGLLKQTEASEESNQTEATKQVKAVVKKKLQEIQRLADENPAFADLKDDLRDLDKQAGGMLKRPGDIRHEAVKKIDRLADAVKKKQGDLKYKANQEMRRMFRRLQSPKSGSEATKKLSKKLRQGDFKGAKEELQKLQEQLATLKSDEDKEFTKKMGEQLAKLAKQLEELSIDKKLAQKLAQAGLKKEDVERMLETLGKKDLEQIKKALEKQGMNQKQINKMMQKLQQQRKGAAQAQQIGKSLQKAATACKSGQAGEAAAGLAQAAGQLSDAEALEAEMAQIEATLAELSSARDSLDGACSQCKGTGRSGGKPCGKCQGNGSRPGRGGMKGFGKGSGGLAPEQQAGMGFKTERAKVHTGKGAIIGQFLVDGEQVKGDVQSTLSDVVTAAEHDASDRIGRNRVPRQYQKPIKEYFSSVQHLVKGKKASEGSSNPSKGDPEGDE